MRAKPTTGIDALPSPEEHDHRTWPAMPEGAACRSDKKKGPRQNPASRRFTAESHVQAQSPNPAIVRSNLWRARMHRSEGRRHSTSLLCDQKLSATEQSRLRPAQDSKKQKYPPGENPSQREPYRSTVALFRAAGWSTAREHQQGHPVGDLTLQRVSRAGTSNCREPALPPCAHTRTAGVHGWCPYAASIMTWAEYRL